MSARKERVEGIRGKADVKSMLPNTIYDNLKKCRVRSKYVNKVTDVHEGVVYIRLYNGVML